MSAKNSSPKYNRPGPRYTSYPTAPVWNDGFGPADLERVHDEAERASTPVSLYMHIPFCERPLSFLRVQRRHSEKQECRPSLS